MVGLELDWMRLVKCMALDYKRKTAKISFQSIGLTKELGLIWMFQMALLLLDSIAGQERQMRKHLQRVLRNKEPTRVVHLQLNLSNLIIKSLRRFKT